MLLRELNRRRPLAMFWFDLSWSSFVIAIACV
jgi:hypothetical protein